MSSNALQAVLDRAKVEPKAEIAAEVPAKAARTPAPRPVRARAPAAPRDEPAKAFRPVREGKRFVGAHFHPEVAKQLKILAAEDGTTIQELLEKAVDILFVKAGKAKIAELERRE